MSGQRNLRPTLAKVVAIGALGGLALGAIATPAFAKDATIIGNNAGSVTAAYVNFYQDPGGLHCVGSYFVSGNQPGSFRVPNGGMYFDHWPK